MSVINHKIPGFIKSYFAATLIHFYVTWLISNYNLIISVFFVSIIDT